MLTRSKARAAAVAAASAETALETKKDTENKLTSSLPLQLESNSVSLTPQLDQPSTSDISVSSDLPSSDVPLTEQPSPTPPQPPLVTVEEKTPENPEVDFDEVLPKMDDEDYYFKRDTRPSKIFKNSDAATFTFVTHNHSRDIEIETHRFRKTFQRFITKLFDESSGFNRGCKLHTSALITYLVVKEGEIVDSPSFYINTRSRVFLKGDDDQEATIEEILTSILEQAMDIIDR